jgi:hypothetical protein
LILAYRNAALFAIFTHAALPSALLSALPSAMRHMPFSHPLFKKGAMAWRVGASCIKNTVLAWHSSTAKKTTGALSDGHCRSLCLFASL